MQGHTGYNQNAIEYRNVLQTCRDMVFKCTPITSSIKCGGFTLKEDGCSDNRNLIVQKSM